MSVERELKLHVLKSSRPAVETRVNTAEAEHLHLHDLYFDTHDRELAKAGVALRLRKEPEGWVQTIKLPGQDALSKIELNHLRPEPTLDLSVYIDSPAATIFEQLKSDLKIRFETDVHRSLRLQKADQGLIELAYDTGFIRSEKLSLPVCELEFELKEGQAEAMFELAQEWQQQIHFVLDFRSKAERGDALANALAAASGTDIDLKQLYQDLKLWHAWQLKDSNTGLSSTGDLNKLSSTQLKQQIQQHLEQVARNAAVIAGIERSDMDLAIELDVSKHIYYLSEALQTTRQLCSALAQTETNNTSYDELQSTLKQQHQAFAELSATASSTAIQQQAHDLAASADFQQSLVKVLAWSIF